MIAALRKSCRMTQQSLAIAADLSVRVIRKAESGGEVRFSTLVAMADAMRRHGVNVQARDLCTDPVEVVKSFIEACRVHRENTVSAIRYLLSEDLTTFVAGDPSLIPFAGDFVGPDGLTYCLSRLFLESSIATAPSSVFKYFASGSEVVAFETEQQVTFPSMPYQRLWQIMKFDVSGGILHRIEVYLGPSRHGTVQIH